VPFSPADRLPAPVLPALAYPPTLIPNAINYNAAVEATYVRSIVPAVCEAGDDQNYGSSATCDVAALQALSKRIHYGKFIAEAKFQEARAEYAALARAGERDGIWALLSNAAVERVLLARVERKARNYGGDVTDAGVRDVFKVEPAAIADIYRDYIIPLTKEVEVDYILERARLLQRQEVEDAAAN
jgi:chorismate mutase